MFKGFGFMPNKKAEKNKFKTKGLLKKGLSTLLATTIGLSSGAVLTNLSGGQTASAATVPQLRDISRPYWLDQTHTMMDGNNFLKDGFWMNAKIKQIEGAARQFSAVLRFKIPGYDMKNLKFYMMSKNTVVGGVVEVKYSAEDDCITLPLLSQTTYDIHVYNGELATENFVCKADFCVTYGWQGTGTETPLLDGDGNPLTMDGTALNLTYSKVDSWQGTYQPKLQLPRRVVPYDSRTVKVVFFASERESETINIDHTLFDLAREWDSVDFNTGINNGAVEFYPEALWGIAADTQYEAHFYKDEVLPGNFICKATGLVVAPSTP
jgi:hypothetical protein